MTQHGAQNMRTCVSALLLTALIGVTSLASEAGLPDTSKMNILLIGVEEGIRVGCLVRS